MTIRAAGVITRIFKAVTDLVDDPFRSLAGELRLAGGYAKDTTPFSEFLWADFLRRRMKRQNVEKDFDAALEPANSSVTKLGIVQAGPANNAGQLIRLCLYSSNANGMPGTLLKDGGETAIARATPDFVNDVVNFAPVTTGGNAIFWVDAQLKQPTLALFVAALFTSPAGFAAGPLPSLTIGGANRCPRLM